MRIVKARFYIMDQYGYLTSVSIRKYNLFQPLPSCYWLIYFVPQYFPIVIIKLSKLPTEASLCMLPGTLYSVPPPTVVPPD